jgi:cytochrome b561
MTQALACGLPLASLIPATLPQAVALSKRRKHMKRIHATLGLALFALLSLMLGKATFAQDPPPDNVEGNWTIYATNHDTGLTEIKHVQIAQYGNQLTG